MRCWAIPRVWLSGSSSCMMHPSLSSVSCCFLWYGIHEEDSPLAPLALDLGRHRRSVLLCPAGSEVHWQVEPHPVLPRAHGLGLLLRLHRRRGVEPALPAAGTPGAPRPRRRGGDPARVALRRAGHRNRVTLGAHRVGRLVDLGSPADLAPHLAPLLRRLSGAARGRGRPRETRAPRRRLCPAGIGGDAVLLLGDAAACPHHPASGAGGQRGCEGGDGYADPPGPSGQHLRLYRPLLLDAQPAMPPPGAPGAEGGGTGV